MLHYVLFALALVSACAGYDPSTPILENELSLLAKLMDDIEARINATAKGQVTALTNASLACWALNLAGFKNEAESAYQASMATFRADIQTKLDQSSTMTEDQLNDLENLLIISGPTGLTTRLTSALNSFQSSVTGIMTRLSQATSFTCSS